MPWQDLLRFSFCFLSFNSSIARPFDSSSVGGFPSISSLFASFPSRPTHSRCLCLGLQEQTSKLTQSNATHILSRFSETHHHLHPHPSLVNTAPFPSCQWTLASLFSHWGFSHRFQKGCRQKTEEILRYIFINMKLEIFFAYSQFVLKKEK